MSKKNRLNVAPTQTESKPAPNTATPPVAPAVTDTPPSLPPTPGTEKPAPSTATPTPFAGDESPTVKRYKESLDRAKAYDIETRDIERTRLRELRDELNARKEGRKKVLAEKQKAFLAIDAEQRQTTLGIPTEPVVTGDAVTQPEAPITQRQPEVPPADMPQPTGDPLAPVPNAPTQPEAPLLQRTPGVGNADQDAPTSNIGQSDVVDEDKKD